MASPANLAVRCVHRYRRINARVACDVDLVGRETGRPVDRVEERIGPVSLVSRYTGLPPTIFVRIRRGLARRRTALNVMAFPCP